MEYFAARTGSPVVLVFQPSWLPETEFQQRLPYRLAPIVSALVDAGYSVRLLEEARGDRPTPAWQPWFEASVATVVWCGEMYPGHQIRGILQLLETMRGVDRRIAVGGGFFPLLDVTRLRLDPAIRAVIVGPGEIVLPQVVDALAEGRSLQELDGVVVFEDGCAIGPARPSRLRMHRDTELRSLDGFALETRAHPEPRIFGNAEPALQLPTGSGCAKRCPFCFDERTPYRIFAAEAVVTAIDRARARSGVQQFLLGELDFFHGKTRALRVAEGLADLAVPVKWFALGSVCDLATFDDAQLARLARSGCVRIELGSESGADSALRRLGKRHTAELILPLAQRLGEHGIATTHNFLFGAPDETHLERLATARLALEIRARVPRTHFNLRVFQIVPATTFGERVLRGRESEFPSTLEQLRDYRQEALSNGRTLPWLDLADEQWVKHLNGRSRFRSVSRPSEERAGEENRRCDSAGESERRFDEARALRSRPQTQPNRERSFCVLRPPARARGALRRRSEPGVRVGRASSSASWVARVRRRRTAIVRTVAADSSLRDLRRLKRRRFGRVRAVADATRRS